MKRRWRYISSMVVIGLCLWTIGQGWALLRYSVQELSADESNVGERLGPFVDDPRVGALARM
jgi:hypothetical protein